MEDLLLIDAQVSLNLPYVLLGWIHYFLKTNICYLFYFSDQLLLCAFTKLHSPINFVDFDPRLYLLMPILLIGFLIFIFDICSLRILTPKNFIFCKSLINLFINWFDQFTNFYLLRFIRVRWFIRIELKLRW